jgi:uncharacterized membrane protein YhaH (DUF805 family)
MNTEADMTFQESIRVCLTKYADFQGTASRAEYWWFVVFLALGEAIASTMDPKLGTIWGLAMILPLLAAGARRLHDTRNSGWLQLFALIPVAGIILLAILLAQKGREGADQFCPAPMTTNGAQ